MGGFRCQNRGNTRETRFEKHCFFRLGFVIDFGWVWGWFWEGFQGDLEPLGASWGSFWRLFFEACTHLEGAELVLGSILEGTELDLAPLWEVRSWILAPFWKVLSWILAVF